MECTGQFTPQQQTDALLWLAGIEPMDIELAPVSGTATGTCPAPRPHPMVAVATLG